MNDLVCATVPVHVSLAVTSLYPAAQVPHVVVVLQVAQLLVQTERCQNAPC